MLSLLFQDPIPAQAGSDFGGSTEIHQVGVVALGLLSIGAGLATLFIIAMCASSTPVMALGFGMIGAATFLIRGSLR
ncbi:MAG: hypothetical protein ACI89X_002535 [Planctomycetota bacterium]